jgi:RNA polymerase sigma-70 factor (ECF subfamily)
VQHGRSPATGIADLYTAEREALVRYATSLTRARTRAEDLVQDAFVRAMSHLDTLASLTRAQQKAWLCRAIRNRFIDQTRRKKRWAPIQSELEREARESLDPVLADVRLWQLLDSIPENHREILRDRFVLGLNSSEIGERHGIPAATARSRLRLAKSWLKRNRVRLFGKE